MTSAFAAWWWALPVLLLPIWWHREKRQRLKTELLATARFLPAAPPQQQRVWVWVERLLLLVRCLLLLGVIAWLADLAFAWRGDTVLLTRGTDPAWAEAQIEQAKMKDARRLELPEGDALQWLAAHEREWKREARWLLLARGEAVPMAAEVPKLAHKLELRVQAQPMSSEKQERHVVIASERAAEWRALFKAYESAGQGRDRYVVDEAPNDKTELLVWDKAEVPDARWQAPLWWATERSSLKQGARGAVLAVDAAALQDLDAARLLYQRWQASRGEPAPYAAPTMLLEASAKAPALQPIGALHGWLAPLLALLFALERGLAHVRRR